MIKSLLDTDLYKLSMGAVFFKKFKNKSSAYKFVCRNSDVNLSHLKEDLEKEVQKLALLSYSNEEIEYLRSLDLFEPKYLDYLSSFQLKADHVKITIDEQNQLAIRVEGPIVEASPWEIYLLATINELYFKHLNPDFDYSLGREKLKDKLSSVKDPDFKIMEFGTRRRHSQAWQEYVLKTLMEVIPHNLIGTSNVYLAMKMGVKPVGTMAHEYLQSFQIFAPNLKTFQKQALKVWSSVYGKKLQVALTDVISTDSFLKDLDEDLSNHYTGLRHDSGDAIEWGEKVIKHFESYKIDPKTKTLVFSDGLTIHSALEIFNHFKDRAPMVFGIGTSLTNDVGVKALNIVIKIVACDNKPVAKISDEPSKAICEDPSFLQKLKDMFFKTEGEQV